MTQKKRKSPGAPREGFALSMKGKRVSLGTVPAAPDRELDPEMEDIISEYLPLLKGNRAHRATKLKMIQLTAPGPGRMTGVDAYHFLNPNVKRSSCASTACKLFREIEAEIGETGKHALQGVHIRRIDRILRDASGAMFTRQFLDIKTKEVISAPPLEDHALRLRSAELMMKVLGVGKEDDRSQPLVVNVISYLPGPAAEQKPWPGGGRVQGGVLLPTVGPDSPAALAARGALPASRVTVDLGDRKNERDD